MRKEILHNMSLHNYQGDFLNINEADRISWCLWGFRNIFDKAVTRLQQWSRHSRMVSCWAHIFQDHDLVIKEQDQQFFYEITIFPKLQHFNYF